MRFPEQKLWDRLRKNMTRDKYPQLRLERIENSVGDGTPDLHCIARGRVSWLELKTVDTFPTRTYGPVLSRSSGGGLSIDQKNWHLDYRKCGGRVATLLDVETDYYFLIDGQYSDTANEMSRALLEKTAILIGYRMEIYPALAAWLEGKIG
jgi:hypothetical protein